MAEELLGPVVRDPRRRARPRLPAPRERGRAVAGARPRVRQALDAQRDAPVHRREDVQVGRERGDDARGSRSLRARDAARLLPDRPLAQADRPLGGDVDCGRGARGELPRDVPEPVRCRPPRANGSASRPPWTTTSTRPRRSRSCTAGATTSFCAAALDVFGLESLADVSEEAPAEVIELAERRQAARADGDYERGRPAARRGGAGGLGAPRRRRGARLPARAATVTRELVYGRRPVRELLRGPREVLEVWASERALARRALAARGRRAPPPRQAGAGSDARPPRTRSTRASSPGPSRTATPRRTSSPRASGRCSSASTRSPTRTTSAR